MGAYDTDFTYRDLVEKVLYEGELRNSRAGSTYSIFGAQAVYNLEDGAFPLLTTKKINFNNVMHELNWMLRGETNVKTLKAPKLWSPWADWRGRCGPIYGHQWRKWQVLRDVSHPYEPENTRLVKFDQITNLIKGLKEDPQSRRHIVNAWNVADLNWMSLPPCHTMFQCYVRKREFLDLQLYQRSGDIAIGIPYNIASYSLLLMMLAQEVGLAPGRFIHSIGDLHAYIGHIPGLKEQISREPREVPSLTLKKSFWELVQEDDPANYNLLQYSPHPSIKFEVAI